MTVRIITDSNGRKHITSEPLLHQPAPVMTDEKGRPVSFWGGKSVEPIAKPAPVQEPVAWVTGFHAGRCVIKTINPAAILPVGVALYTTPPAAPVQPAALLKEADVLMMAETHGIDPNTKGLYGFYIDCISNQPAAQPAVPDAIHHTDLSEHPQYIEGWNDCRAEMLKGMKA